MSLEAVWAPFREGYRSENAWQADWNEQLPYWFEVIYLRSVVHAFRLQHPVADPTAKRLLDADIKAVIARNPPIRFDFKRGKAVA
jgi:hypothetical protein